MTAFKWLRWDVSLFLLCVLIFVVWPQLDYWWAGQFYRAGEEFYLRNLPPVQWVYRGFAWLQWPILLALLGAIIWALRRRPPGHIARRRVYFLLVLLLLGPGLLVNELVKKNSGRERPDDTFMFAGDSKHQDFLDFSGSCKTNCSFVSGHAALGFWFIGFAWALGRRRYLWLGIGIGAVVGLGRNIQGNHYLSDVVFAFWMVYLCAIILAWRYELVIDETAAVENR